MQKSLSDDMDENPTYNEANLTFLSEANVPEIRYLQNIESKEEVIIFEKQDDSVDCSVDYQRYYAKHFCQTIMDPKAVKRLHKS